MSDDRAAAIGQQNGYPRARRAAASPVVHADGAGGLGFGLIGKHRPLGEDLFAHPLVLYFVLAGAALLVLRAALGRPVPEVIPERMLLLGCIAGVAAFLVGNALAVHVFAR